MEDNILKMANVLSDWNRSTFGNILKNKRRLIARIEGIQRSMNIQPRQGLHKLESKLKKNLDEVLEQEELLWYQKSREEWIVSGDRNTKFYHASTIVRRSRNKVDALKDNNGQLVTESDEIKRLTQNYFTSLFQSSSSDNPSSLQQGLFPKVDDSKLKIIHGQFSIEEIKQALFDMAPFKAPGPDGLHAGFFQKM